MRDDALVEGYADAKPIRAGDVDVYLARRAHDSLPVVLEVFHGPRGLARAREKKRALEACRHPRIPRAIELRLDCELPTLVSERPPGAPLETWLDGQRSVDQALAVAIGLCELLQVVHSAHWVYGDVSPASVNVDPDTLDTALADFGSATPIGAETLAAAQAQNDARALRYVAPEQTGRVRHGTDPRTDLYALGATLYHAVTGSPPFDDPDPDKLVLDHLTREPTDATELRPDVPIPLARVLARLLLKEPADRYPNARAVQLDLEAIRDAMASGGTVAAELPLPSASTPERLQPPNRLYGRDEPVERLSRALEAADDGPARVFVVRGPSGAGKSAVAQCLRSRVVAAKGRFAIGRASAHHDRPHAVWLEVIRGLVDTVLLESAEALASWRSALRTGLGQTAGALAEAVPELEFVMGEVEPGPRVGPREAQTQLATAVERCLRVFSNGPGPLVVILEDLHSADPGSLVMLRRFLRAESFSELLIGITLRSSPSDARSGAAEGVLATLRDREPATLFIDLGPLAPADVERLLEDTLGQSGAEVSALAAHVARVTGNLPLFVHEFIERMHAEGLLRHEGGRWFWDHEKVTALSTPEGAIAVVAERLTSLSPEARRALELASCFDDDFSIDTLRALSNATEPIEETVYALLDAGLLRSSAGGFQLAHERLREAVQSRLEPAERSRLHLAIGLFMLESIDDAARSARVLEIADHLNLAREELPAEARGRLLEVDLRAGQRALRAGAGVQAAHYFDHAQALFLPDDWQTHHAMGVELQLDHAESLILCGEFSRARELLDALEERDVSKLEFAQIAVKRIYMCALCDPPEQAVKSALAVLRKLGVRWPEHPSRLRVRASLALVRFTLRGRSFEDALEPAKTPDPDSLALLIVLNTAGALFSRVDARLGALASARAMRELLVHGYLTPPGFSVAAIAMYTYAFTKDRERALADARAAFHFIERAPDPIFGPRSELVIYGVLYPFLFPRRRSFLPVESVRDRLCECGDPEYQFYADFMALFFRALSGDPIRPLVERLRALAADIDDSGHGYPDVAWMARACALLPKSAVPSDELVHALAAYDDWASENPGHGEPLVRTTWMMVLCTYRRFDLAIAQSDALGDELGRVIPWAHVGDHAFYRGIAVAGFARLAPSSARGGLFADLRNRRTLLRELAQESPDFEHMSTFLDAEAAALEGDGARALSLYARATEAAIAAEFPHHAALCREQHARLLADQGRAEEARATFRKAAEGYRRWGAHGKADAILR